MVTKSKLTVLFALAVVGVAFPAIAQSFDPEAGTGNVLPFSDGVPAAQNYQITAPTNGKIAARHRDLYGYATVPRRRQLQSHRASYSRVLDHTFGMSPRERTNLNCDGIAPGHHYGPQAHDLVRLSRNSPPCHRAIARWPISNRTADSAPLHRWRIERLRR